MEAGWRWVIFLRVEREHNTEVLLCVSALSSLSSKPVPGPPSGPTLGHRPTEGNSNLTHTGLIQFNTH